MLILAGLGLGDEKNITIRALELAKQVDECFIELYTSKWEGNIENLEKMINKKIKTLNRSDLEENSQNILELSKDKNILIFIPGDPLLATTHINLLIEAKKRNINTLILHNSSIFSAIGESGLHIYKFGKCATIPFTRHLEAVKNTIYENKSINAHTLLLLDLDFENKRYLTVKNAIEDLLNYKIIKNDEKLIVMSKIGSENKKIAYGSISSILNYFNDSDVPAVIIIPSNLHFSEKEYLDSITI
ncbi:MAG: diphthine synthase [Candidatus Aenigmatarchaeota archaeon]